MRTILLLAFLAFAIPGSHQTPTSEAVNRTINGIIADYDRENQKHFDIYKDGILQLFQDLKQLLTATDEDRPANDESLIYRVRQQVQQFTGLSVINTFQANVDTDEHFKKGILHIEEILANRPDRQRIVGRTLRQMHEVLWQKRAIITSILFLAADEFVVVADELLENVVPAWSDEDAQQVDIEYGKYMKKVQALLIDVVTRSYKVVDDSKVLMARKAKLAVRQSGR